MATFADLLVKISPVSLSYPRLTEVRVKFKEDRNFLFIPQQEMRWLIYQDALF